MIRPLLSSLDLPQGDLRVLGGIRKHGAETVDPHAAIYGAMNDAIALINCPKVSVEARCPPCMTVETSGFSDVCMRALLMPRSENDRSIT